MPHKRKAWTVMLVASLTGATVAINRFTVRPVLLALKPNLGPGIAAGGWPSMGDS